MKRLITLTLVFAALCCISCKEDGDGKGKDDQVVTPPAHVAQKYVIGNYYNKNGVQGIVYKLNSGDTSGMIVSIDEGNCIWTDSTHYVKTDAVEAEDGSKNMEKIKALGINDYPAFSWCNAKNSNGVTGWYLPASNQLWDVAKIYSQINDTLSTVNGSVLIVNNGTYWSSTDADASLSGYSQAYYVKVPNTSGENPGMNQGVKTLQYKVRAVRAF